MGQTLPLCLCVYACAVAGASESGRPGRGSKSGPATGSMCVFVCMHACVHACVCACPHLVCMCTCARDENVYLRTCRRLKHFHSFVVYFTQGRGGPGGLSPVLRDVLRVDVRGCWCLLLWYVELGGRVLGVRRRKRVGRERERRARERGGRGRERGGRG